MDRLFRWQCISMLSRRSRNESLYYRWCIDLSIGTSGEELFTDGKLLSIGTVGTDGQGFRGLPHALEITLTTCFTKEVYTLTDGVFISPSVPTDNLALPTVNCLYHPYRWYRWTRFLRATSCPWNNANYLFYQTILDIHRWCIHFSVGTDGQPRFTDGKLPLPSVPSVPMEKVFERYLMPLE